MSIYTQFRSFNLSSRKFADLNRELQHIFGALKNVLDLDIGYRSVEPGKLIKG